MQDDLEAEPGGGGGGGGGSSGGKVFKGKTRKGCLLGFCQLFFFSSGGA